MDPVAQLAQASLQGRVDAIGDAEERRGGNDLVAIERSDSAELKSGGWHAFYAGIEIPVLGLARQHALPGVARDRGGGCIGAKSDLGGGPGRAQRQVLS